MTENTDIKLTPELEEMVKFIQDIIPQEDWKKPTKEETLKMVLATFIALITEEHNHNDEDENQDHNCWCGHCHH